MTPFDKNIKIAENSVVQEMGSGIVVLNLNTERFYELDGVGKRIWELLTDHQEYALIFNTLQDEYEVSGEQLEEDISRLLEDLRKAELIDLY